MLSLVPTNRKRTPFRWPSFFWDLDPGIFRLPCFRLRPRNKAFPRKTKPWCPKVPGAAGFLQFPCGEVPRLQFERLGVDDPLPQQARGRIGQPNEYEFRSMSFSPPPLPPSPRPETNEARFGRGLGRRKTASLRPCGTQQHDGRLKAAGLRS